MKKSENRSAKNNIFNLSKLSQFDDVSLQSSEADASYDAETGDMDFTDFTSDLPEDKVSGDISFDTPEDLKKLMDENASDPEFVNKILEISPDASQSFVKDSLQRYYEPERDEADKTIISAEIFKEIHGRGKGEQSVEAIYTKASIMQIVNQSNAAIEKFAKQAAGDAKVTKTAKSYNLKKQAQFHGTNHTDFLNWGPGDKQFFPYSNTGYVGSKWHTWLRGRDHNFLFDETPVDFEAFWRGNIMDKYSRPYRNEKGEWVGGYMNKRFEVDRNIPVGNNLQLLPGQTRRPYMPEWATWEARMTAARDRLNKENGYAPAETGYKPNDPYEFKAASVKKK